MTSLWSSLFEAHLEEAIQKRWLVEVQIPDTVAPPRPLGQKSAVSPVTCSGRSSFSNDLQVTLGGFRRHKQRFASQAAAVSPSSRLHQL